MSRVAVTGGAGFLGGATVRELERRGHEAVIIDRSHGTDILDSDLWKLLGGADACIHLAGVLGTSELFDTPQHAIEVNVTGTLRVLQVCESAGVRYVGITMPESGWANMYTATKHCAQDLASAWHRHKGVPVSHVRAFNAYGVGQKHGPGHPQKIIPTFATCAWNNQPIPVWGSGEQTVDLIHVGDIARMLVDAIGFGDDEVFDAGTGHALTVNEVAAVVIGETGCRGRRLYLPMRDGEDEGTIIVAKGEGWELLDWHPEPRWDALLETIRWYRP